MKKRGLMVFALAGIMLLTACGGSGSAPANISSPSPSNNDTAVTEAPPTTVSSSDGNSTQTEAPENADNQEVPESGNEKFTLTMMSELFSDQAPDLNNAWFQEIEKLTGVKMDVNFVPTLSYVDKTTAFIASQSLPMVFTANSNVLRNNNLLMALDSDGFWALDDYLAEFPNLNNFVEEQVWENSKIHGHIYGIPRLRILPRNGAIMRQDWLDNLGLEAPETFDELYDVAKAFTENDPDKNGQDDTIGIVTAYQTAGNRGWNGIQTLATAYGAPNNYSYQNGVMVPDFASEEYLKALQFIKKLYDDGYMNKDFAEITASNRYEYFDKGTYGIVFGVIDDVIGRSQNLPQVVAEAKVAVLPAIHEEGKEPLCNATSGYNGIIMFTKFGNNAIKTEDELRSVLAFYDKLATPEMQDVATYGVEGIHHELNGGTREMIFNQTANKTQLEVDCGDINQIMMTPPYVRRDSDDEVRSALYNTVEARIGYCVSDDQLGLLSETYDDMSSDLDAIMMDASVKFILGTIDEAGYWNEYENWKKRGGDDVIQEYTAQYEQYKQ